MKVVFGLMIILTLVLAVTVSINVHHSNGDFDSRQIVVELRSVQSAYAPSY